MICVACNNTKCKDVDLKLDGVNLEMFNFVVCLEITEAEESQGICNFCLDELKVSFAFKKRCLEIFANVFEHENEDPDNFMDILDQSLDDSINLNDLLIPEVCIGNTVLSALDVSDNRKCRYCFLDFDTKEECQAHLEEHRGDDKPYKCPHDGCDSTFKARKNLKDHYLVHSNERPFPCHYCSQTFKSSSNRSKHERRIHPEERKASKQQADKNVGHENGNQSTSKENIKKEPIKAPTNVTPVVRTKKETIDKDYDGDRLFRCDHEGCTSSFRTRSSLKDHQKVHSDERPYQCHYCPSAFKSSSNRSKHERGTHSKEYQKRKLEREQEASQKHNSNQQEAPLVEDFRESSPPPAKKPKIAIQSPKNHSVTSHPSTTPTKQKFQCRYCDRAFNFVEGRDRHETVHKFFDCGFCSKNFKTQELLKEHTKIHTEQTKFLCPHPDCNEIFSDRRTLRSHRLDMHDPEEFICEVEECGRIFPSARALKNHKRYKHIEDDANTINCDICLQKFNRNEIQEHLKLHI